MIRLICLLIGYVFGLFQSAYIFSRRFGVDIRDYGSGNAGMTNTLRTFGTKAGMLVLVGDMLKMALGELLVLILFSDRYPDMIYLLKMYTAIGCIIGHNFPFYMKFRGGKGVAVTAGFIMSFRWPMIFLAVISFLIPFNITHYVSLGSMCMAVVFYAALIIMGQTGFLGTMSAGVMAETYFLGAFITGLLIFQHRANIKRLLGHCERKTYLGKKNKAQISKEEQERMRREHELEKHSGR